MSPQYLYPVPARRLGGVAGMIAAVAALVAFARTTPAIVTDSDIAVTELYTELATSGELRVGPYSRFGWNHPGPLYFYIQAPLYALAGHRAPALFAGALAINLVAIGLLAWAIAREQRGPILVLAIAACVLLAWRAPRFLASPWTAHVPVLPALTFVVLCAAIAAGRVALLPVAAIVGSFVVQTHVGFAPMTAVLSAATLLVIVLSGHRRDRRLARTVVATLGTLAALWSLPIVEALEHEGGNAAALWRFFVTGATATAAHSWTEVTAVASYALIGVMRPDFALPWGGHFAPVNLGVAVPYAIAQAVMLAAIGWRDLVSGRRFDGSLALTSLLATFVSVWSITRIRDDILDHEIFWLSALGALNLAIIVAVGVRLFVAAAGWTGRTHPRVATVGCVLALISAIAVGARALHDVTGFERRRTDRVVIVRMHEAIRRYIADEHVTKPLVTIESAKWSQAAGVLLRLHRDGNSPSVPDAWIPMFTRAFAARGDEDATISIAGAVTHADLQRRPDTVLLFGASGTYVDAFR